jgi:hypothetical protein
MRLRIILVIPDLLDKRRKRRAGREKQAIHLRIVRRVERAGKRVETVGCDTISVSSMEILIP